MKISNELKVGLLALTACAILILGYNYLKGKNLFSNNDTVYVIFTEDVDGLTPSSTVNISGLNMGLVADIKLMDDFSGNILVALELKKSFKIPKNVQANMVDQSVLGGKAIKLEYSGTCDGDNCLQGGDTIVGSVVGMFESMTGDLDPYIEQAQAAYSSIDSTIKAITQDGGAGSLDFKRILADFQGTLTNLNNTTRNLNALIANSSGDIQGTMSNLNALSGNLKNSQSDIDLILGNIAQFSKRLEALELEETVDSTQMTFATVNNTLRNVDGAINSVDLLMAQINTGNGTVAQLLKDDKLYNQLDSTLRSIQLLTDDIRLNPKRYINLRRKSPPYKVTEDPADN